MTEDIETNPATDGTGMPATVASPTKATQAPRGGKGAAGGAKAAKVAKKPTRAATKATGGKVKPGRGTAGKTAAPTAPKTPKSGGEARKRRTGTKQEQLIAMLKAKDGATVDEIARAFGWQAHTVRGALYGALKTKLKLNIVSEKVEGRGRVYRIAG